MSLKSPFRNRSAAAVRANQMPNMTPMVDVVMVILVFFMATAAVMGPEWILKTALPTPKASSQAAPEEITPVRLVVGAGGAEFTIAVGAGAERKELKTDLAGLDAAMASVAAQKGADKLAVSFDAADDAPYDAVVRAHEACLKAGITRVGVLPPK